MQPVRDSASEMFGPYEVHERLGIGGMATVHRAKKRGPAGFERTVALKRMLQHLAEDALFVDSFVREAKVASMLMQPNIAQIYDFGRIGGVYYIAMELVTGLSVRKLLRCASRANEGIPLGVVLTILAEMCDALDYAHSFVDEHGQSLAIVHRDITPSNLIVAHTGHVKVIDFGIAKANSRQLHTDGGIAKGKLGYMSPEVALGKRFGSVSDIFSAGVVAWELVTASPLFSARTDFETMLRIREGEIVPPSRHNPSCPSELDSLILAALERDPDRRLPGARAFRTAIDRIAASAGVKIEARQVASWIRRYAQPEDAWFRGSVADSGASRAHAPGGQRPSSPEPEASVDRRPSQHMPKLLRSASVVELATELWGEDGETQGPPPHQQPDLIISGAVPLEVPSSVPGPGGPGSGPSDSKRSAETVALGPRRPSGPNPVASGPRQPSGPNPVVSGPRRSSEPNPAASAPRQPSGPNPVVSGPRRSSEPNPAASGPRRSSEPNPAASVPRQPSGPNPVASGPRQPSGPQLPQPSVPSSGVHDRPSQQAFSSAHVPAARRSRTPLVIFGALAAASVALGASLVLKQDGDDAAKPEVALHFKVTPGDSVLVIGDQEVGRGSQFEKQLAPGEYAIAVRHEGYESWARTLTVRAGENQTIAVALEQQKIAAAAPAKPKDIEPRIESAAPTKTPGHPPVRKLRAGDRKQPSIAEKPAPTPDKVESLKVEPPKITPDKVESPTIESPKVTPDKVEPPKVTSDKVESPKVEPPKAESPKLAPDRPASTPVVTASAVTKISGEVPVLRTKSGDSNSDVLVKMCIDEQGRVSSVKVSKSTAEVASELERALRSWRYKPYLNKDQKPSAVCFPLPLRLVMKGAARTD